MKRAPFNPTLCAAALATAAALGLAYAPLAQASDKNALTVEKAARGKYLVDTGGCMDCHTPMKMGPNGPEHDMTRHLSGHPASLVMPPVPALPEGPWMGVFAATNTAWAGPWGVSFTANLTPDADTGLGKWTVKNFTDTFRTGRHKGSGREILPPMPIPAFNHFTDADLEAIFAFLRTVPAVKNKVPEPWAPKTAGAPAKQ
jgi:hypothetical protein